MKTNTLENELDRLEDALSIISKFEDGDSRQLKRNIRNEIEKIENEIDEITREQCIENHECPECGKHEEECECEE